MIVIILIILVLLLAGLVCAFFVLRSGESGSLPRAW